MKFGNEIRGIVGMLLANNNLGGILLAICKWAVAWVRDFRIPSPMVSAGITYVGASYHIIIYISYIYLYISYKCLTITPYSASDTYYVHRYFYSNLYAIIYVYIYIYIIHIVSNLFPASPVIYFLIDIYKKINK